MRMIVSVVYVLVLIALVEGYAEIRDLELNGAYLVDTSSSNYGMTAPTLSHNNWKTVSVNGNIFEAITPSCQVVTKDANSLGDTEKSIIGGAKSQLESVSNPNSQLSNGQLRYSLSKYSFDGRQTSSSSSGNIRSSTFQSNGYSMTRIDDTHFTLAKPGMPNNLARLLVDGDVVTFVYVDGTVKMKPTTCLKPDEQQLLQDSRTFVNKTEEEFKQNMLNMQQNPQLDSQNMQQYLLQNLQNMQRNMQNMQQSLQNIQQNMQQNMQNTFGNGFPYNLGNNGNMMNQGGFATNQNQQPYQQQQQMYSMPSGMPGSNSMSNFAPAYNVNNQFASNSMAPNPSFG